MHFNGATGKSSGCGLGFGGVEQGYKVNNAPASEDEPDRTTPQRGHFHPAGVTNANGFFTPPEPLKQSLFEHTPLKRGARTAASCRGSNHASKWGTSSCPTMKRRHTNGSSWTQSTLPTVVTSDIRWSILTVITHHVAIRKPCMTLIIICQAVRKPS